MDSQLDPRDQRQVLVHPQRQNANDFRACRRKPANEQDDLQLKPASMLLKKGVVVRWPRIRRPVRQRFQLVNVAPPGFRTSWLQDIRGGPYAHDEA